MLDYNGEETLDICGMGDCPGIDKDDIPSRSVGKYQVTWMEEIGVQSEAKKLCQDCKDYLIENKIIEEIKQYYGIMVISTSSCPQWGQNGEQYVRRKQSRGCS